jgi:uncharacterized protein
MSGNGEFSSPINFPCDFVVKVMGNANQEFIDSVINRFKRHFNDLDENKIVRRNSKDHNYVSLTVTVYAENQAQLDSLYQELSDAPEVLVAL